MKVSVFWRVARLIILLNLIPFVRSCDDTSGLTETVGFPFPYSSYVNANYTFHDIAWAMLVLNVVIIALLLSRLNKRQSALVAEVTSLRYFVFIAVIAVLFASFNGYIFLPLAMVLYPVFILCGQCDIWWPAIDVLSRGLFIIMSAVFIALFFRAEAKRP